MLRKRTRSSVSAGELNEGLASRPRDPPRGSGLRNGSKYKSRMLSEGIKKLPITLASPEKGTVTIGEYIGEVKGGMMHGEGTIKFYETHFDGSQFEGKFKRGKLVGQGILKYKDGVVYAGEQFSFLPSSNKVVKVALHCQDDDDAVGFSGECTGHFVDGVIHGTARVRYGNGKTYEGCWHHNSPHGKGVMIMPDGEKSISKISAYFCEGIHASDGSIEWLPVQGEGAGLVINSAGGIFVGGRLIQGWLKFHDGTRFDGSFCESGPDYTLKHGKYVCAHMQHTYTGEFLNNAYHGQGSLQWSPDPEQEAALDSISAGGIFAYGELTEGWTVFRDGSRFEGSFCDGSFKHGKYWWDGGQCTYTGGFLDDEFHGQGSVRWLPNQGQEADFDIHSAGGTFVNGCLTQGWIKFCDGSHFEGSFFDSDPPFAFKHGKYRRRTSTGGFLDDKFHGAGVLYNDKFNPWMEKPFSMELAQPNGTFVTVGLVYEGTYENGKKHGRGTWTLRPFTPTLETESFLPITIYEGEWRHGMYHGKGRYTCLPHYERIDEYKSHTSPGSANYNPGKVTKAWHNFEGAEVQGGFWSVTLRNVDP